MLNGIKLSNYTEWYAECHFAECHYNEGRQAGSQAEYRYAPCHYTKCCYAECIDTEQCNAKCHYAGSQSADLSIPWTTLRLIYTQAPNCFVP